MPPNGGEKKMSVRRTVTRFYVNPSERSQGLNFQASQIPDTLQTNRMRNYSRPNIEYARCIPALASCAKCSVNTTTLQNEATDSPGGFNLDGGGQ